mgnify:FL=1
MDPQELSAEAHTFRRVVHCFWPLFMKEHILEPYTSAIYDSVDAMAVNAMLLAAGGTFDCSPANQAILDELLWT